MTATGTALVGLVMWSVVLTVLLLVARFRLLPGRSDLKPNAFRPDGSDLDPFGQRVTRAHLNSLENLACAASLMLLAVATGQTAVTDGLAMWLLAARVGQSTVHMISTALPMVLIRATLFTVQVVIWVIWGVALLK